MSTDPSIYQTAFYHAPMATLIISGEGMIVKANAVAVEMLGYSLEETEQLNLSTLAGSGNGLVDQILQRKTMGKHFYQGVTLCTKAGRFITVDISLVVSSITEGKNITVCTLQQVIKNAMDNDILQPARFDESLRRSEQEYRILFEASPSPKWIYDLESFRIQDVNFAAIKHYGYTREEFLGKSLEEMRPPSEVAKLRRVQASTVKREGTLNFGVFTHLKKDGTTIQVEVSGSKVNYQQMECMLVESIDVTQREIALEILLDREAKLRQAHEIAKLGHWQLNPRTQNLYWSREVFKIWGIAGSARPDFKLFMDTVHPDDRDRMLRAQEEVLAGGKSLDVEHRIILEDGTIKWVHELGQLQKEEGDQFAVLAGTVQDITPQKLLELSLEESNRRYQFVSKATSDAIWDWDILSDTIYWGDGIEYVFGYKEKTMKGTGDLWKTNIHPDDLQRVVESVEKFTNEKDHDNVNWEQEYRFKKANGEYANVVDKAFLIKNEVGLAIRMVGAMQDITKRKETEDEVRRSNERFELLGKAANDAVWEWDMITNQGWANETHQDLYGLTLQDLVPQRPEWISRLHEDDRQRVLQSFQDAVDHQKEMWHGEYRMHTANRGWISVYDRTYMEYDAQGNVVRKIGSMMDISGRKQEEQRLKLLESVIINATDAVIITEISSDVTTPGSKIIFVNEAFVKMTGYHSEDIVGKSPGILHGPESDTNELEKLDTAFANFKPCTITILNYKKNGQAFWVNLSVSPVANEKGWYTHWIAIQRDVTAQKLAEIHLSNLNDSLQKYVRALASSNAELEQFAFVASHDLQEPLRMVTGFVTQLEKKYGDIIDDRGKKYIAFAVDGAQRMRQIILDLLEFSKVGRAEQEPENINLNDLVDEIKILLSVEIQQKNARLLLDKLPVVKGHVAPMRQVFLNLIGNALKYAQPNTAPQVQLTVEILEKEWQFAVKDNGIGIREEYFERIFVIFQRLHHKHEFSGTGMGLAITKKIIDSMGGRIWISSTEGVGSTFYFTLPRNA